nr:hypothetical protein [Pandoravirus belohorizontensis]
MATRRYRAVLFFLNMTFISVLGFVAGPAAHHWPTTVPSLYIFFSSLGWKMPKKRYRGRHTRAPLAVCALLFVDAAETGPTRGPAQEKGARDLFWSVPSAHDPTETQENTEGGSKNEKTKRDRESTAQIGTAQNSERALSCPSPSQERTPGAIEHKKKADRSEERARLRVSFLCLSLSAAGPPTRIARGSPRFASVPASSLAFATAPTEARPWISR